MSVLVAARTCASLRSALWALLTLAGVSVGAALQAAPATEALRVCADPDNLPQSNRQGEGYENKIAQALADDLGRTLQYTWFPQRMGFVRNTLRRRDEGSEQYACDVIIGVPKGYELTLTTQPYMRSTYALLFIWRQDFDALRTPDDLLTLPASIRDALRIGVFARSPGADWVLRNGLMEQAQLYAAQSGDPKEHPANIIERDLAAKKIDLAIVWGPVAGYLVREHAGPQAWYAVPFLPDAQIKFDYEISMGVRFGEQQWRATLDDWLASRQGELEKILVSYRVPLLDQGGRVIADFGVNERARAGGVRKQIPLRLDRP